MPNSGVNWYAENIIARVKNATQEILEGLAIETLADAQERAPVDTGFMKESGYIDGEETGTFNSRTATLTSPKTGQTRDYETVFSPPPREENEVTVGFAADYSIFVESDQPFLYPALTSVSQSAKAIIERVGREHF